MQTKINPEIIDLQDLKFLNEYFELLISRITYSSMSLEPDLGDIVNHRNAIRLNDNMKAFKILLTFLNQELSETEIITIANMINKSAPFISDGYRRIGRYITDTNIPISAPENIHKDMLTLLQNYQNNWQDPNLFTREAKFHIDFIRIHPFEDGNGRTGRLLLNYNLLKQGIAPVIITNDLKEEYENCIQNRDVANLTKLFEKQSVKELAIINKLYEEYQSRNLNSSKKLK